MCNNALKAEVSVADAETSLDDAAGKFQHAAALALYNWGNVHMCAARKAMDGGRDPPLEEGGPPGAAIATAKHFDQVVQRLDQAEAKFTDALEVKPDFWDAMIAMSQRKYERARLLSAAAGLSGDDAAGPAPGHDAAARGREAEAEFASAVADFGDLLAKLPEEPEKEKPAEKAPAEEKAAKEGGAEEEPAPEQPSAKAQVLVMWGNTLFGAEPDARQDGRAVEAAPRPSRGEVQGGGVRAGGHRPGAQGAQGGQERSQVSRRKGFLFVERSPPRRTASGKTEDRIKTTYDAGRSRNRFHRITSRYRATEHSTRARNPDEATSYTKRSLSFILSKGRVSPSLFGAESLFVSAKSRLIRRAVRRPRTPRARTPPCCCPPGCSRSRGLPRRAAPASYGCE